MLFLLFIFATDQVPRQSRKSILQDGDGDVMPPGVLATIEDFNYDFLVTECLGTDNNSGIHQIILFLEFNFRQRKNPKMVSSLRTYLKYLTLSRMPKC